MVTSVVPTSAQVAIAFVSAQHHSATMAPLCPVSGVCPRSLHTSQLLSVIPAHWLAPLLRPPHMFGHLVSISKPSVGYMQTCGTSSSPLAKQNISQPYPPRRAPCTARCSSPSRRHSTKPSSLSPTPTSTFTMSNSSPPMGLFTSLCYVTSIRSLHSALSFQPPICR